MEKQVLIPPGVKAIIGFLILNLIMFVVGQGGAVVAYDTVAQWGLQELRETIDPVILAVNRGIGLADVIIGVPLFVLAIVGLWRMRFYGAVASWMVLGISLYWPTVALWKQHYYLHAGVKCLPFGIEVYFVLAFVFLFSTWATWYQYKNRLLFNQ